MKRAAFAVPGSLETPTGGYGYDRRIIAELERLGWPIELVDIGEGFPWPSEATRSAARARLLQVRTGWPIVIDGLALGVLPDLAAELAPRNPLLALVHHPLALEWGLSAGEAERLRHSERAALASAHGVVVTSAATARLIVADYDVPADRVSVARPGTDPAPRARGSEHGMLHLLSVGAIVPRKGFDVLVAALATLAGVQWRLSIAGDLTRDAAAAEKLRSEIARHGLTKRIELLGAVPSERLATLYDTADLFVLASHFEGYGMAYAEALAHGLPVIGTTAGAIPETVPREAGLLVAPGDTAALADALHRAITDTRLRRGLAEAALAAARQLPTWPQSGAIFARALEKLA
ncbi:MAG: glycosyltransferase family 4 protein [Bradyrhizobium sp.]|uniref:glycosyltransferase family 4 protein n=1 Tax=Bradyrhizobium sp. TaxID=376 RepID=UPI001D3ECE7A|nr:glycosyltransferase family 4 protein [Bradyrhizobium sp.]MBV9563649.1 glycosyltransferase family 4 protein [Bradyrhizobium sp.]